MLKKSNINIRELLKTILRFAWPILPLGIAIYVNFIHIASSPGWRDLYLYHGDSVTLSMILSSIKNGEPFNWVLSSQLFIFPEGLIYAISSVLTSNIYGSLVLNTIINFTALGALFWTIGRQLSLSVFKSQLFSVLGVAIIVFYGILEKQPLVNQSTFVTLFSFNTYYYGVILASLALFSLALLIVRLINQKNSLKKLIITMGSMLLVASLTQLSNPLLLLQFIAPLLCTLLILVLINRLRIKTALLIAGTNILAVVLAQIGRKLFEQYIGSSVGSYLNFDNIPSAINSIDSTITQILSSKSSTIEYIFILAIALLSLFYGFYIIYCSTRNKDTDIKISLYVFVAVFASITPAIVFILTIASGSAYTRYFLPIAFIPILSFAVLMTRNKNNRIFAAVTYVGFGLLFLALISFMILHISQAKSLTSADQNDPVVCFDKKTAGIQITAVGSFMTSRPLDLYTKKDSTTVLQVYDSLKPFIWMNNKSNYASKKFNSVIVDHVKIAPSYITAQDVAILGEPSVKYKCDAFDIYYFKDGSSGMIKLNKLISS